MPGESSIPRHGRPATGGDEWRSPAAHPSFVDAMGLAMLAAELLHNNNTPPLSEAEAIAALERLAVDLGTEPT